jgi:hypothetical protein
VDAVELLRSDAPFVVDTSAWWRFSSLSGNLAPLVRAAGDGYRMWITPIVRMEILYSARNSTEYIAPIGMMSLKRPDSAVSAYAIPSSRFMRQPPSKASMSVALGSESRRRLPKT